MVSLMHQPAYSWCNIPHYTFVPPGLALKTLHSANAVYSIYTLYGSHNKQGLFPHTELANLYVKCKCRVFTVQWKWSFKYSFIPWACAEYDDSLPFRSFFHSSPLYTLSFHQLVFHPPSPHLAIYFSVYLSALLLPYSYWILYRILYWKFHFLPFSVHAQNNVIYLTYCLCYKGVFNHCINFFIG